MTDAFDRLKAALADRYAIERELGAGGMATVYLAEDLKLHRKVALKVLRPELASALGPDRFLREIDISAKLAHPHILPLHDCGEADGFLYYVMTYVEGQSLRDKLAKEGELPIPEAVRILRDVVDALSDAHEHGVIHRDIKPDNVLLARHHALVTDFGVAKAVSEATGEVGLTTEGVALGTPAYMSPEQASADPHIDHRADIYAVGSVAYELLTGRPPFVGTTPQEVLASHVTKAAEPVTEHRQTVPPALAQLVMKCLEKKPADRWQTAEELLPHLEALATPSGGVTPIATMPVGTVRTPLAKGGIRLWLALGAVVASVVGWWLVAGRGGAATETANAPIPIAVLVFENRGAGEGAEYLGEGIAEDVNTQLAKISGFEVKAHASAMQLSYDELTYAEIGDRLGADFLMHGSFRHAGDSVRITVQLIDPETESVRWADDYTRVYTASNMFAITRDVAERVASDLQLALSAQEQERLAVVATEHTEAYQFYLQGRFLLNQRGEGILRGLEHFEQAVALDSLYAPAYAGIADAYSLISYYGMRRPSEVMPLAEAAALRALALDSNLADAHTALGNVREEYNWDMPAAEMHFRRAVELNPSYAQGYYGLAEYLSLVAYRDDEALAAARRAVALDPLSPVAFTILGNVLYYVGEHTEAIAQYRRSIALEPMLFINYSNLARLYRAQGRCSEALAVLDTSLAVAGRQPLSMPIYASVLMATGDTAGAAALYDELVVRQNEEYVPNSTIGCIGILLGRIDESIQWAERAVQERDPYLAGGRRVCEDLGPSEVFDDTRWDDFWRRLGMR